MNKIFFALVIAGLCFGAKENFVPETRKSTFNRNLSIEIFGSIHIPFTHDIQFNGAQLPDYMWAVYNCIV